MQSNQNKKNNFRSPKKVRCQKGFTQVQKQIFLTHLEEEAKLKKLMDEQSRSAFTKRNANIEILISAAKRKQINLLYRHKFTIDEINGQDKEKNTALYYTVQREDLQFIQYLLERNADPNIKCSKGNTVLHLAYQMNIPHIVGILLDNKASINIINDEGYTPLAYAQQKDHMLLSIEQLVVQDQDKCEKFDNNNMLQSQIKSQKKQAEFLNQQADLKFSNKVGAILSYNYVNDTKRNKFQTDLVIEQNLDRQHYLDKIKNKQIYNQRYNEMLERQNSPEKEQELIELNKEFEIIRKQIYNQ